MPTSIARVSASASCSFRGSAPSAHGPSMFTSAGAETMDCLFSPLLGDWLYVSSSMGANMASYQSTCQYQAYRGQQTGLEWKGRPYDHRSRDGRPGGDHLHRTVHRAGRRGP